MYIFLLLLMGFSGVVHTSDQDPDILALRQQLAQAPEMHAIADQALQSSNASRLANHNNITASETTVASIKADRRLRDFQITPPCNGFCDNLRAFPGSRVREVAPLENSRCYEVIQSIKPGIFTNEMMRGNHWHTLREDGTIATDTVWRQSYHAPTPFYYATIIVWAASLFYLLNKQKIDQWLSKKLSKSSTTQTQS